MVFQVHIIDVSGRVILEFTNKYRADALYHSLCIVNSNTNNGSLTIVDDVCEKTIYFPLVSLLQKVI